MKNFNVLHYVTNIIYIYTIYLLMTTFQKKESAYSKNIQNLSYGLFYIIVTTVFSFINIPVITLFANLICLFMLSFLYSSHILNNLQISIIIYTILATEELIISTIANIKTLLIFKSEKHLDISIIFLGNILFLLSAILIKYFFNYKNNKKTTIILPIFNLAISFLTIIITFILASNSSINSEAFTFVSVSLIFINLFSMWGYEQITTTLNEQFKIESLKEKTKSYEKDIQFMDEQITNLRKYKHDEKNHLLVLMGLMKGKESKDALKYIENLLDIYSTEDMFIKTENKVINSLLNYKIKKMKDNKIKLTTEIKINKNLPVSDYDMSIILGNLIDNAMDAQMKINEDNRKINIKIVDEKNKFTITINNIFNGEIKEKNGILISKKEDSSSHGLGLNSVKECVEKYDGIFKINYNDKKFTSYVMFIKDKN
ncbi:hypothetical protein HMPREF9629_00943 [Peptoanaerobacter stomatis]|uniref:Sensor histidine kinase NatK-like C-terminal domain-containing protein n=1 Tax=Peptoanaerobacter stomatis TaxID=796937 RepID=G9X3I6_9FIRM|nr:sensor histidine kinase [Peptoanaerobacter stomatis]EHL09951.1 hypothetical protein HMPREF9629_00943 [Peptoanaerobacter stomatis]